MLKKTVISLMAAFLTIAVVSCGGDESSADATADQTNTNTEPTYATADLPTWTARDIDGNVRKSTEWIGQKPTVINFWGTWCPPCRREIPDLVKLYKEYYPEGVEIVSLAVNDSPEKVRAYVEQADMDWVQLMGEKETFIQHRLGRGIPTTIFLTADGKEVARFEGAQSYETFKQAFEKII